MADLPFNEPNALPIRTNRARKLLSNFIGGVPGFQMLVRYLADIVERVDSGALLQGPNVSVSGGYFAGADTVGQTGTGSFVTPDGVSGQDENSAQTWGFDNQTGALKLKNLIVPPEGIPVKNELGNFIGSFDFSGTLTWGDPVAGRFVFGPGQIIGIDGGNLQTFSLDAWTGVASLSSVSTSTIYGVFENQVLIAETALNYPSVYTPYYLGFLSVGKTSGVVGIQGVPPGSDIPIATLYLPPLPSGAFCWAVQITGTSFSPDQVIIYGNAGRNFRVEYDYMGENAQVYCDQITADPGADVMFTYTLSPIRN